MGLAALTQKHLLLCEGAHDWQFFEALIRDRNLPPFEVTSCGNVAAGPSQKRDGIEWLTKALDALPALPTFPRPEAILVVADNDSDPKAAFKKVQDLIAATGEIAPGRRYAVPPVELTREGSNPVMVIMMLPWTNISGALDSLLYISAARKRPTVANCVDEFAKCTKADVWPITKTAKMKLRSLISAAYHQDSYLQPAWVWREKTDLVPIGDPVFDQIEAFLRNFPTFCLEK